MFRLNNTAISAIPTNRGNTYRLFILWAIMTALFILWSALISPASAETLSLSSKGENKTPDAPQCDPNWQVVSTANAINGGILHAVSVISPSDIWAVGAYDRLGYFKTMTMHWDGTSWSLKNGTNGSTQDNILYGVKAIASNDVWAVGAYYVNGASRTLTIHWNGSYWATVASPNPGGHVNVLKSVTAASGSSVWAVGYFGNLSTPSRTLTMKWGGSQWTTVSSPNPDAHGANFLYGITVTGTTHYSIWAVGCSQFSAAWGLCGEALILRWNASLQQWNVIAGPDPGGAEVYLYGITAVSDSELWAVGTHGPNGVGKQTLILHYINNSWSVVPSPNVSTSRNYLHSVSAVSANDVWAVGYQTKVSDDHTLIEHWDGSAWSVVSSPDVGKDDNRLYGVAALSATDVWSVGYDIGPDSSYDYKTLAERYNPCN